MLATDNLKEAERLMTICNSCRYCEGLCAVFPAMELRRSFAEEDLNYLANLCHNCGACYHACQYSPPHEFAVNVPQTLARVRVDSYAAYAWPRFLAGTFERNGVWIALSMVVGIAAFCIGLAVWRSPEQLFARHVGPGAFYTLIPHDALAVIFGVAFLYAMIAIGMSVRTVWKEIDDVRISRIRPSSMWQAIKDAGSLRYLDGGGVGCSVETERAADHRRLFHHMTFYGFMLCFAATSVATLYHYLLVREAPYPWYDLPVLLGAVGGVGLLIGPIGLLMAKRAGSDEIQNVGSGGMDTAFILTLFLTSLTGMALLLLRETSLMGITFAIHLGTIFAFFVTMPYSKLVHGFYRFGALMRYAQELQDGPRPDAS